MQEMYSRNDVTLILRYCKKKNIARQNIIKM